MKRTLPAIMLVLASPGFAEETRQLDSHEHGVGELNIAIEGETVAMEFHAPGADIVGFEYEAESADDLAAIETALAALSNPLDLFSMSDAAECTVTEARAELESEENHDHHDEEEHDDHADEDDHDEDHEEHDEEEHEAGHTEFHAEYLLTCSNPASLSEITFAYFDQFENALEVEVQIVTATGASAFEVERDAPELDISDLF